MQKGRYKEQLLMSKVIIVESKNGASNIDKSRQATNISNLQEDIDKWKDIAKGNQKNKLIPTLISRLEKNYEFFGFDSKSSIAFPDVQKLATAYINADPWLQITFCRDSTRQSVDEEVQTATLRKYLNDSFENITNGSEVLFNGNIISKKEATLLNEKQVNARSVDAVGVVGKHNVKVFQKYSKVAGSGQSHQTLETQNWLEEAAKVNIPNMVFVAQLDGAEAESHIEDLRSIVKHKENIFVGNSEAIIDWLSQLN